MYSNRYLVDKNEVESDECADASLNELEIKEMLKRFMALQSDLIHKRQRQNILELLDMLEVLLEVGVMDQADYIKMIKKIKAFL